MFDGRGVTNDQLVLIRLLGDDDDNNTRTHTGLRGRLRIELGILFCDLKYSDTDEAIVRRTTLVHRVIFCIAKGFEPTISDIKP